MIQVMRFDASGNHQWTRLYHDQAMPPAEGPSSDWASASLDAPMMPEACTWTTGTWAMGICM